MFLTHVLTPFIEVIEKFPNENSFFINDNFYSYRELAKHISKIRLALQEINIKNKNIGLVANDDLETYASIFAIWLEGFAYVPLHPKQPIERSLDIISQADIEVVMDSSPKTIYTNILTVETSTLQFEKFDLHPRNTSNEDLALILFTSGSTGKPKGVEITRKNIGAMMKSFWELGIRINAKDRCLQCFDLTFDTSCHSFLVPLISGACVYTIPHDQIKYSYLYSLLVDHQLTYATMVPSMIRYLSPYFDEINIPSMRYNICCAEGLPVDLAVKWSKCIPKADIFNFYGNTEAAVFTTHYKFNRKGNNKQLNGIMSIGKLFGGFKAVIIDEEKNILGANQKGELCISGDQVTSGYWKNQIKNEESFFEIEMDGVLTRFYRTGDCCFIDNDGDIMIAGRIDFQVKIQGYRVELGEIEYHAREFLNGPNAVAIAFDNKIGNVEIALFIERSNMSESGLVEYLKGKMSYYMIPTHIIKEHNFELNTNGKIDRIKLKNHLIN